MADNPFMPVYRTELRVMKAKAKDENDFLTQVANLIGDLTDERDRLQEENALLTAVLKQAES